MEKKKKSYSVAILIGILGCCMIASILYIYDVLHSVELPEELIADIRYSYLLHYVVTATVAILLGVYHSSLAKLNVALGYYMEQNSQNTAKVCMLNNKLRLTVEATERIKKALDDKLILTIEDVKDIAASMGYIMDGKDAAVVVRLALADINQKKTPFRYKEIVKHIGNYYKVMPAEHASEENIESEQV